MQRARNLAMDLGDRISGLRFLIHLRDPLFTSTFREVFTAEGLRSITMPPRTPRMNAICEQVIGTLRRELLDRILILNERHLTFVLREYLIHYNGHRPHQSRNQRPPDIATQPASDLDDLRSIHRKPVATGMINEYHDAAYPQLKPRNSIFERHTRRPGSSSAWLVNTPSMSHPCRPTIAARRSGQQHSHPTRPNSAEAPGHLAAKVAGYPFSVRPRIAMFCRRMSGSFAASRRRSGAVNTPL
ncbi:hypothetical protein GCM10022224_082400 [Nonomuraea antimicrobica]|uniref:Integrase catalytic domain-containing protein n=1 Tax=Nonomuraea antimicrobica TaxID=561173 RepID=A0ABP7DDU5_9ACTN